MTEEVLVRSLVEDLAPVRRLPSFSERARRFFGVAVLSVFAAALVFGLRADLLGRLQDPEFWLSAALPFGVFWLSARAVFRLSVPGVEGAARSVLGALAAGLVWVALVALRFFLSGDSAGEVGVHCVLKVFGIAALPTALLVVMLRKAAPLGGRWTGALALAATAALANVATQAVCVKEAPGHVFLWHVLPVLGLAALGAVVGPSLLSRARKSTR